MDDDERYLRYPCPSCGLETGTGPGWWAHLDDQHPHAAERFTAVLGARDTYRRRERARLLREVA